MKKTRLFKHFITLIHCCALAIPLFTLIGTFIFNYLAPTAYFASHKNGNQSTYDVLYKYQSNQINSADDLVEGNIYQLNVSGLYFDDLTDTEFSLTCKIINKLDITYTLNDFDTVSTFEDYYIVFNANLDLSYNNFVVYSSLNELNDIYLLEGYDYYFNNNPIIQFIDLTGNFEISYFLYTDYNEIESVEIENHNDFEDMKNYQPKTFDDACFYTMQSMGVLTENGESMKGVLDNVYGQDVDYVSYIYEQDDDLSVFTTPTGVVNYDWFKFFDVNGVINDNQCSWLFFMNFYINYFINISIICFMPIVIMCFFKMCTNLVLKFTEKGDY